MRSVRRSRRASVMCSVGLVVLAGACGGGDDSPVSDQTGSGGLASVQAPNGDSDETPAFEGTWTVIAFVTDDGFSGGTVDPSATFELNGDRIVGTTGCRSFDFAVQRSGDYAEAGAIDRNQRGQSISVSAQIDDAAGACDEAMEAQDTQLPLAFGRAQRWAIDGDTFFLLGAANNEIVAQRSN